MADQKLQSFATIPEAFRQRAKEDPEADVLTWLDAKMRETAHYTRAQLDQRACAIAENLRKEQVMPGDFVLVVYPPCAEAYCAILGCLYAGAVAVPVNPPHPLHLRSDVPTLNHFVADCCPKIALTTTKYWMACKAMSLKSALTNPIPWPKDIQWLETDGWLVPKQSFTVPPISTDSLAFLMYTSGSTSMPKGVQLSHSNILLSVHTTLITLGWDDSCAPLRACLWLPHTHIFALVFNFFAPTLKRGGNLACFSALDFIADPSLWIRVLSKYRCTFAAATSSAVKACTDHSHDVKELDLSALELLGTGAEPLKMDVIMGFWNKYASAGLKLTALRQGFGATETTGAVSGLHLRHPATEVIWIDRDALESENKVVCIEFRAIRESDYQPASRPNSEVIAPVDKRKQSVFQSQSSRNVLCLLTNGMPAFGLDFAAVNTETRERLGNGQLGEIWITGDVIAVGYHNKPETTQETMHAHVKGDEKTNWYRTGDMGFVWKHHIFITGRLKEMMIIQGRNIWPEDVETSVTACDDAIARPRGVAAFPSASNEEHFSFMVEVRVESATTAAFESISLNIRKVVAIDHGAACDDIYFVKPGTIPITRTRKIQRSKAATMLQERQVLVLHHSLGIQNEATLGSVYDFQPMPLLAPDLTGRVLQALAVSLRLQESFLLSSVKSFVESCDMQLCSGTHVVDLVTLSDDRREDFVQALQQWGQNVATASGASVAELQMDGVASLDIDAFSHSLLHDHLHGFSATADPDPACTGSTCKSPLHRLPDEKRLQALTIVVNCVLCVQMNVLAPPGLLASSLSLLSIGLDSVHIVQSRQLLQDILGIELSATLFHEVDTIGELVSALDSLWTDESHAMVSQTDMMPSDDDADDPRPRPSMPFWVASLLQTVGIILVIQYVILCAAPALLFLNSMLALDGSSFGITGCGLLAKTQGLMTIYMSLGLFIFFIDLMLVSVAVKWLVLGRIRAGTYPVWGWFHLRWWFAQSVTRTAMSFVSPIVSQTPLLVLWNRMLGGHIAWDVKMNDVVIDGDLVHIAAGVSIGAQVHMRPYTLQQGTMIFEPIHVGQGCDLGLRSCIGAGSTLQANVVIKPGSHVPRRSELSSGSWIGLPIHKHLSDDDRVNKPALLEAAWFRLSSAIGGAVLIFASTTVAWLVPISVMDAGLCTTIQSLPSYASPALMMVVFMCLFQVSMGMLAIVWKWLLLGRVRPGTYLAHGWFAFRRASLNKLVGLVHGQFVYWLWGTPLLNLWLNLMGSSIHHSVSMSISGVCNHDHDLVRIGKCGMIGGGLGLGCSRLSHDNGMLQLDLQPITLRKGVFTAARVWLSAPFEVKDDAWMGLLVSSPSCSGVEPGHVMWGTPPRVAPAPLRVDGSTTLPSQQPTQWWLTVLTILAQLPLYAISMFVFAVSQMPGLLVVSIVAELARNTSLAGIDSLFTMVLWALSFVVGMSLFHVLFRRLVVPVIGPSSSKRDGKWEWKLHSWRMLVFWASMMFCEQAKVTLYRAGVLGSVWYAWWLRAQGVHVGSRALILSMGINDGGWCHIGSDTSIDENAMLSPHDVTPTSVIMKPTIVGNHCDVGPSMVIEGGTTLQDHVTGLALSRPLSGEVLPEGTTWMGNPARRWKAKRVSTATKQEAARTEAVVEIESSQADMVPLGDVGARL